MRSTSQARLQADIRRLLGILLQRDVSDPRLAGISVTRMEPSDGNQVLHIWVHRMGEQNGAECVDKLNRLASHFSHELRRALPKQKRLPKLRFFWDEAFEKSGEVLEMLARLERDRH